VGQVRFRLLRSAIVVVVRLRCSLRRLVLLYFWRRPFLTDRAETFADRELSRM
jgi:hypothetical protein